MYKILSETMHPSQPDLSAFQLHPIARFFENTHGDF